ncbi:MAG: peptide chain release factor N(5)-glutamine methyltransferase [Deltaproteobacteria bacterium]|nr:MAG: peptide chain release factor N(5)-glutamine methyltransferase [Deltaproteobacteria bacterium]
MAETWTVLGVLKWTAGHLRAKGVENGRLDAEWMLADLLGLDRVGLYLHFDRPLQADELAAYRERVRRRARREPLQYIVGHCEFWSLRFRVEPGVLIPRADTEVLVEEALARMADTGTLLDVGTGSGCIALSLLHERQNWHGLGLDCSEEALRIARANAAALGLAGRIDLARGELTMLPEGPFDLIASNPPYIPAADLADLMPEVRDHEPRLALDGGPDGLQAYRHLAGQVDRLTSGGWLLVEVGIGQAQAVRDLLAEAGLTDLFVRDDYAGIPRVVGGRRP